ncbi:MAG: hypothetical protein ACKVP7_11070 [Hyphomicrobiaceae bacterium]
MVYSVDCVDYSNIMQGRYDRMIDDPWPTWNPPPGPYYSKPLEPWMFDAFPSRLEVHPSYPLTDVAMYGLLAVNEGIKRAIEDIEPGVHQFVPVKVIYGVTAGPELEPAVVTTMNAQGRFHRYVPERKTPAIEPTEHQYYTLWINHRLPGTRLDPASPIVWDRNVKIYPNDWANIPGLPLVLRAEIIGNRQLWNVGVYTMISDTLYERLRRDGLGSGWRFEKQIVV